MNTIGTFCLIKNEMPWIKAHLLSWLPHLDEMVFFDCGSTDGTLETLRLFAQNPKIRLFEYKDPENLREAYVNMSNEALQTLRTDYAMFCHPDMILEHPGNLRELGDSISYTVDIRSFAGEPGGELFEILGRGGKWKNIYRLRNPNLGCHYFGWYGSDEEDCYFRALTGEEHRAYWCHDGMDLGAYPYCIKDSGAKVLHYSDVRTRERRVERMVRCLVNQGLSEDQAKAEAEKHPRVTLKDGGKFSFVPAQYHPLLVGEALEA